MAFYLERPGFFEFIAGQYITVTLLNPLETDEEGSSRCFSIASAPYEKHLMFVTRMRDTTFKRVLKNLPVGSEIKMDGPYGAFYLHKDASRSAVFLIGGIGITPVFSILKNAARKKLPHKLFLFYSNKRPEDAAFLNELRNLEKENPNFKLIPTMTEAVESKILWQGETGFINAEMLKKYLPEKISPVYYASGPSQMVKAMRYLLGKIGTGNDNIKLEEFSGY